MEPIYKVTAVYDVVHFNHLDDRVRYVVGLVAAPGPMRLQAELSYQPIGYRWANNLEAYEFEKGSQA